MFSQAKSSPGVDAVPLTVLDVANAGVKGSMLIAKLVEINSRSLLSRVQSGLLNSQDVATLRISGGDELVDAALLRARADAALHDAGARDLGPGA